MTFSEVAAPGSGAMTPSGASPVSYVVPDAGAKVDRLGMLAPVGAEQAGKRAGDALRVRVGRCRRGEDQPRDHTKRDMDTPDHHGTTTVSPGLSSMFCLRFLRAMTSL